MSKIQLEIEDEELASVTTEQYSAVMCPPVPGSNKIH